MNISKYWSRGRNSLEMKGESVTKILTFKYHFYKYSTLQINWRGGGRGGKPCALHNNLLCTHYKVEEKKTKYIMFSIKNSMKIFRYAPVVRAWIVKANMACFCAWKWWLQWQRQDPQNSRKRPNLWDNTDTTLWPHRFFHFNFTFVWEKQI